MRTIRRDSSEVIPRLKGGVIPLGLFKGQTVAINQPILYIDTENQAVINSKTVYVNCDYKLVNDQGAGQVLFQQTARIRGRGNSTWTQAKKPYKVKLTNTAPILDMPSSKDWALLANYFDPSRIRNAVAFEMARRTSMAWAPHSTFVEVVLNGNYAGLYQFIESVEIDTTRVNINKIKATDTTGRNLTGGYLWEIDVRLEENNETGFRTRLNVPFIADTPDLLVTEQFNYTKTTLQALEDRLFAENFTDATLGYKPLIDLDSWIDWYLLAETTANNDSGWGASLKLYKDKDPVTGVSKIFMGPAWDYDLAFSLGALVSYHPATEWWTRLGATWITRMLEDPAFQTRLQQRWTTFKTSLLNPVNSIYDYTTNLANSLSGPMSREVALWPPGTADGINSWLSTRITWLDSQFSGGYSDTTPPAAPTGISTSLSSRDLTVSWTAVTSYASGGEVVGYRIRIDGLIAGLTAFPYSSNLNSIVIKNLSFGSHSLTVEARDRKGNWSSPASGGNVTVI